MKIAIFASGNGSNFQVLADQILAGELPYTLSFLFCDQKKAYVLKRAEELEIPVFTFSPKEFTTKAEYETEILKLLKNFEVEAIVLAGYLRIIGPTLLKAYPQKIINLHPSLLPAFKGLHGILDAYQAGVKETGVTVHFIDDGLDTGPIIAQRKVFVEAGESLEDLEEKIHQVEHELYPEVLKKLAKGVWKA